MLKELLHAYGVQVHITRDRPDDAIKRPFKRLSLKVHPDRGGKTEDQQRLNDAYRAWNDASKHAHPAGRPQETSATRPEKASDEELHRMTKRAQKMATRFRDFIGGSPDSSGSSLALKEAFGRKPISSGFAPPPQLEGGALCDSA